MRAPRFRTAAQAPPVVRTYVPAGRVGARCPAKLPSTEKALQQPGKSPLTDERSSSTEPHPMYWPASVRAFTSQVSQAMHEAQLLLNPAAQFNELASKSLSTQLLVGCGLEPGRSVRATFT